ncbi:MAG: FAD-dependent oxidoreductase, partial [Lentisphaeraceae bacterium]|nr:FAD-dependent oxidoreductase [Lentisphaeraceae bacterium]
SENLYQVPPDTLKAKASQQGAWESASAVKLDTLRPADVNFVYVLGGCANISREAAEDLMKPLQGIELGKLVGAAAAADAKERTLEELSKLTVSGTKDSNAIEAEIGEMLNGLRSEPDLDNTKFVKSPAGSLPIIGKYDTVVVGGGTGGAPAGVGAARGGAKTLVLEYLHGLGGVGTLGRISKYYHGNRVGFTAEVDKGVVSMAKNHNARDGWNIEAKMEWLRSEIVKAGGDVWFRTLGAGAVTIDNKFVGVVVVTPHGRGVVIANTVIDATGNAVIPACANLPTQAITGEHISVQGTGLPPYTPGESYKNSDWTFTDDDDVLDMWRIHVVGRQKYAGAFDQGQLIDTRARRRIVGDLTVSPMDIINKRVYPDIITVSKSNFDNHGFSSHSLFMITPPDKKGLVGNVPYRALLPKGYDGILVTGLGMSAHGDAMPVMRMQPDVQNQGYAAGKASAMAAENGTTVRNIDIKELQKHLVEQDIIPSKYVGAKDTYPVADSLLQEAVNSIGKNYSGIALVLTDLDRSKPLLQKAYKEAKNEDAKLRYAHVLGMIYDSTGSETLIKAIEKAKWDKGWNFRGMGQFGATTSPLDNLIIALGRTKDTAGIPTIIKKLNELTPASEFSHSRAVSIALETYKTPEAAKHLADMLKKPGIAGHSFLEIDNVLERSPKSMVDNSTRNNSLRELILARALYRCGDYEGIGEKTLKAYANDYRGHYATHAKAVLKEGK